MEQTPTPTQPCHSEIQIEVLLDWCVVVSDSTTFQAKVSCRFLPRILFPLDSPRPRSWLAQLPCANDFFFVFTRASKVLAQLPEKIFSMVLQIQRYIPLLSPCLPSSPQVLSLILIPSREELCQHLCLRRESPWSLLPASLWRERIQCLGLFQRSRCQGYPHPFPFLARPGHGRPGGESPGMYVKQLKGRVGREEKQEIWWQRFIIMSPSYMGDPRRGYQGGVLDH